MAYSVLSGHQKEPRHLYQPFSRKQWAAYPFASEADLQWFRDAKLGLFLHIGLSSQGAVELGWGRHTRKAPDGGTGPVPDMEYDGWATTFSFAAFDAKKWVQLAKRGGMQYIVLVTKHHDGFHMWDTAYSNHKITNTPFGRDYVKEMTDACHEAGIKVGLYYSQRDWYHPDYEPLAAGSYERIPTPPYYRLLPGEALHCGRRHRRYIAYLHHTVKELMTNYGKIDILWWDASWYGGMFTEQMWEASRLEQEVRQLQPHILINNRASLPGDFDTPECQIGTFQDNRPWETCMTLGSSWVWNGQPIKSFRTVLHQMLQCVCGDGNYLPSIGAMPNGAFDRPEEERIAQLGQWLSHYGESVYHTRGGPWRPELWGGSVYCGNTAYLHLFHCPNGVVRLAPIDNSIVGYTCLTGESVTVCQTSDAVTVTVPDWNGGKDDVIVKLTFLHPITGALPPLDKREFDASPAVYGAMLLQFDNQTITESATFPLPQESVWVTGIVVDGVQGKVFSLEADGQTIWSGICQQSHQAVPVYRFEAGAQICGRKIRCILVRAKVPLSNVTLQVYGKKEH